MCGEFSHISPEDRIVQDHLLRKAPGGRSQQSCPCDADGEARASGRGLQKTRRYFRKNTSVAAAAALRPPQRDVIARRQQRICVEHEAAA